MVKFNKLAPWLILIMLILWIAFTESPYQKGGTGPLFSLMVPAFVIIISVLMSLLYDTFHFLERAIVSIVIGLATLFVVSFILTPCIVNYFYSDKTWFLWETKHRLFINTVYYGLNAGFITILTHLYFNQRRQLGSKKKKVITILWGSTTANRVFMK